MAKKYFDRIIYMRNGKIISDANRDGDPSPEIR
jgi:ABC-type phosphate/phosphonate transport system ATPase subunit